MSEVALVAFLAVLVKHVVDNIANFQESREWKGLAAMGLGILLCLGGGINIVEILGVDLPMNIYVAQVVSGIGISGNASLVYDLVALLAGKGRA